MTTRHPDQTRLPRSKTAPSLADGGPAAAASERYAQALSRMVDDAVEHRRLESLVDAMTRTLGGIVAHCGVGAAGDVMIRLGTQVTDTVGRRLAAEEAERARKDGRAPN